MADMNTSLSLVQRMASVLWPSFLVAGIANAIFFSIFDPKVIFVDYDISSIGAYSIGFFFCWLMTGSSCLVTMCFLKPCGRLCQKPQVSAD